MKTRVVFLSEETEMLGKVKELIFQDVKSENETKKVAIVLRLNSIVMCIYFLFLLCSFYFSGEISSVVLCVPCFFACAGAFYTTYLNRTRLAVVVTQLLMVVWIVGFVHAFGWDCGVQHFIFVLLILNFTTGYGSFRGKIFMSILACALRLALYAYTNRYEPAYALCHEVSVMFQVINTVFIFAAITAILGTFTEDSQEMEKKLVVYNEKLHRLASIDPLTGLLNRRSMKEYLQKKEQECRIGRISNLSLAIGDIDFFKKINDTYGHECGDLVLKRLSELFLETMGEQGEISRWGGEEFLFVFDNINGDEALIILDEIQKKLSKLEIPYGEETVRVTMTFGLSEYDFQGGMELSINDADTKLYRGKESGRNRIIY